MSNMSPGNSPLDFITKNLQSAAASRPPGVEPVAPNYTGTPVAQTPPPPVIPGAQSTLSPAVDPMPSFGEETPPLPPVAAPLDDEVDEPTPEIIEKEHWQQLRAKHKEAKKVAKEFETKFQETQEKLQRYETGEIVPDLLREQNDKIERLSQYEKLHNFKASDEAREQFYEPINQKTERLKEVFKDYGFAEDQIPEAINTILGNHNTAELNAILANNFDVLGAQEVKGLVQGIKEKQHQLKAAEAEPIRALEQIQAQTQQAKQERELQRTTKIQEVARSAWVDTLTEIRNEGKVRELIRSESDPVFNETFVDPILQKSAQEYGKVVQELAKLGISEIPKELGKGLANMVLRAVTQSLAFEARDVALTQLDKIESVADRANQLLRPKVGGGVGSSRPVVGPTQNLTPQTAAQQLSNSILRPR